MADKLSGIGDAIRKASEAFADAMAMVSKTIENVASQASGPDRDRLIENWLRIARMSKDGVITAIEHGFEIWERGIRRTATSGGAAKASTNPMEAWAENFRKAAESFLSGGATASMGEEARKQADAVQKTLSDGIQAWRRLWEPKDK